MEMITYMKDNIKLYENLLELEDDQVNKYESTKFEPTGKFKIDEDAEVFVSVNESTNKSNTIQNPNEIEESLVFRRFTTDRDRKYSEKEMNAIRESCRLTIVHDYSNNDWYHISDKERAEIDQLHEISLKLASLKSNYRRVDEYIKAMRIVFEAWSILEKKNYLHSKEEFFKLVSSGKITSNRIIMPKLKKINQYNVDMIIQYISNPNVDVSHLRAQKKANDEYINNYESETKIQEKIQQLLISNDINHIEVENVNICWDEYVCVLKCNCDNCVDEEDSKAIVDLTEDQIADDSIIKCECEHLAKAVHLIETFRSEIDVKERSETEKERIKRILSNEEIEYLADPNNTNELSVENIKYKYIKGYDHRTLKRKKNEKKKDRNIREITSIVLNSIQNQYYRDMINGYMISRGLFEREKQYKDSYDKIKFASSWQDDEAVDLYDMMVEEERMNEYPAGQRYLTFGDRDIDNFFKIMEAHDVNTIQLRRNMSMDTSSMDKKKIKEEKKSNQKIESALMQRITKLNNSKKFQKISKRAEEALNKYKGESS
jgi:hypothetical protein